MISGVTNFDLCIVRVWLFRWYFLVFIPLNSMDIHPGGSNILVSSYDKKVTWLDTELSTKPYRVLRGHKEAVRKVLIV